MRDTAEELDSLLEPIFPFIMFSKSANIAKHYELYINQKKIMVEWDERVGNNSMNYQE